jgi:hypothetical protein
VNIEYGDEVDGAVSVFQVNLETSNRPPLSQDYEVPEEDSVSVQYDSDHFAVEYELEPADNLSESEHSSHSKHDYLVVQKESDIEFWADYSDTETGSDVELGEADQWLCSRCQTRNISFYRNCSKCWAVRPDWLLEVQRPTSTTNPTTDRLPAEPCGSRHGYYAATLESNDEQPSTGRHSNLRQWRGVGDRVRRRRVRVVSASSSDRNSESLTSLSDDEGCSSTVDREGRTSWSSSLRERLGEGERDEKEIPGMSQENYSSSQDRFSQREG